MAMSTKGADDAAPYINVTPLIDVLLVLLIIFMVVSPLKPSRFEAKIPTEPDQDQPQNAKPNPYTLVVSITNDGKIKLNNDEMDDVSNTGKLGTTLAQTFQDRERNGVYKEGTTEVEKTVFVKAPRSIKYGDVVKVFDAIKGSGAQPIGLQVDDLPQ